MRGLAGENPPEKTSPNMPPSKVAAVGKVDAEKKCHSGVGNGESVRVEAGTSDDIQAAGPRGEESRSGLEGGLPRGRGQLSHVEGSPEAASQEGLPRGAGSISVTSDF